MENSFIDDQEKMIDFFTMDKDDFLKFYSYLNEKSYLDTCHDIMKRSGYWNADVVIYDDRVAEGKNIRNIIDGIQKQEWLLKKNKEEEEVTTEDRIAIIKNRAQKNIEEANAARDAEEREKLDLINQIKCMAERIGTIINLANICVDNGIEIPNKRYSFNEYDSGKKYGYPHEFIAEGIRHHTGLIRGKNKYHYIGIENGGACGTYDFWTDGFDVWAVHERDRNDLKDPRIRDMKQFIEEFPVFEKAFLNWIDSLA